MNWPGGAAGYLLLPGLLPVSDVAAVLSSCDALLDLPIDQRAPGDKAASGTMHLEHLDRRIGRVAELISDPVLSAHVAQLLGASYRVDQASLRSPRPGYGRQRLHADDVPRLTNAPPAVATLIVPLVDFTPTNGPTRVVPGSHDRPDLQRRSGSLEEHLDEVRLTAPAGTGLFFSGHLLHGGTQNESTAARPALQVVWRVA